MQQLSVNVSAQNLFPYCKLTTLKGGGGAGARISPSPSASSGNFQSITAYYFNSRNGVVCHATSFN